MGPLLAAGAAAGAVISLATVGFGVFKVIVWLKSLNDLVQHELRPNSGSSIKDAQKHQLEALTEIKETITKNQDTNVAWQLSMTEKIGNHDGRLTVLENKK